MTPLDARTSVCGIIGWPVDHSLSPAMHNAAFSALAMNWAYVAFPVDPERVGEALRGLAALGVRGANVTIPHKQAVIEHCSATSEAVDAIGAANTLIPDGSGGFRCDNTDASGFLAISSTCGNSARTMSALPSIEALSMTMMFVLMSSRVTSSINDVRHPRSRSRTFHETMMTVSTGGMVTE